MSTGDDFIRKRHGFSDECSSNTSLSSYTSDGLSKKAKRLRDSMDVCNYRNKIDTDEVIHTSPMGSNVCFLDRSHDQLTSNFENTMDISNYIRDRNSSIDDETPASDLSNLLYESAVSEFQTNNDISSIPFAESTQQKLFQSSGILRRAYAFDHSTDELNDIEPSSVMNDTMDMCNYRRIVSDVLRERSATQPKTPARRNRDVAEYFNRIVVPHALFDMSPPVRKFGPESSSPNIDTGKI